MEGILDALAKLKLTFGAEAEPESKGGISQSLIVVSGERNEHTYKASRASTDGRRLLSFFLHTDDFVYVAACCPSCDHLVDGDEERKEE
jgi:hypothetical protein